MKLIEFIATGLCLLAVLSCSVESEFEHSPENDLCDVLSAYREKDPVCYCGDPEWILDTLLSRTVESMYHNTDGQIKETFSPYIMHMKDENGDFIYSLTNIFDSSMMNSVDFFQADGVMVGRDTQKFLELYENYSQHGTFKSCEANPVYFEYWGQLVSAYKQCL